MILSVPVLRCKTCGVEKAQDDFLPCHLRMVTPKTPAIHCRVCVIAKRTAAARARGVPPKVVHTPEVRAAIYRRRQQAYRDGEAGRATRRRNDLKRYGITPEQYDALLEQQGGQCATAGCDATTARSNTGYLCVDHDHTCCAGMKSCGRCIRGLLCGPCNFAVGMASDDPARLRALADYIEGSR